MCHILLNILILHRQATALREARVGGQDYIEMVMIINTWRSHEFGNEGDIRDILTFDAQNH
jgi:hypothetical protein